MARGKASKSDVSIKDAIRAEARQRANYVGGRPKDESKLVNDPRQVRVRLRRMARNGKTHTDAFKNDLRRMGYKPVEEWDFEELALGRCRDATGKIRTGTTPTWIGERAIQDEIKRRLHDKTYSRITNMVPLALKAVQKLIENDDVDDNGKPIVDARTKLAAATFIIERVVGKTPVTLEVSAQEDKVRTALVPAIVLDDGQPQGHLAIGNTIDGEIVEDDEEKEWGSDE